MRGFLWLCAGALAPTVGNSVTTLTQDRSTTKTLAFGRCSLLCLFRFDFMTCSPCTVSFPTSLCPCSLLLCWLLRGQMAFDALLVDGDFFARSSLLRSALSHLCVSFEDVQTCALKGSLCPSPERCVHYLHQESRTEAMSLPPIPRSLVWPSEGGSRMTQGHMR